MRPNATCPVCGASVYFYANEYGSRVYFDELGPPWPKHPCTAGETKQAPRPGTAPMRMPVPVPSAPAAISGAFGAKPGLVFALRSPQAPLIASGCWLQPEGSILHVHPPDQPWKVSVWQSPYGLAIAPGDCVYLRNGWVSYFDRRLFDVRVTPVAYLGIVPREEAPIVRLFRRLTGR
ncbi:hypothetical protein OWR29_17480 [Actinoplanes sp. Pm04-4]|uniref:Uncharacterized protein n=1 Tax=Paractinoplanes pyxinae TaxID=2997416 RepID=A0ABT4B1N7_9ACTN|nr:hypothetical protein [Actinoplanes pyxinae]MCY1139795.1 hypothetical protein [Actinoplanes pyxinae]